MYRVLDVEWLKTNGFQGIKVVPDLHGCFPALEKAYEDALRDKLFLLQLGDLVDRGCYPAYTVELMLYIMSLNHGLFTRGNHDQRYYEFIVYGLHSTRDRIKTKRDFLASNKSEVQHQYLEAIKDSPLVVQTSNCYFIHAAYHPDMATEKNSLTIREQAMRGVEVGRNEYGLPIRSPRWVHSIPNGKTVYVGHESMSSIEPHVMVGNKGGVGVFCDNAVEYTGNLGTIDLPLDKL